MVQGSNGQGENENREILRHQRLEQPNNALANEFRDLKPEIGRAYNTMQPCREIRSAFRNRLP